MEDSGNLIHFAPAMLNFLGIPYTGARAESMFLTSAKTLAKKLMHLAGILTPPWFCLEENTEYQMAVEGPCILKSVWSMLQWDLTKAGNTAGKPEQLRSEMNRRRRRGEWFAEAHVEGRNSTSPFYPGSGPRCFLAEILFGLSPGK
jgi:D-alanine-D-alanine ligase